MANVKVTLVRHCKTPDGWRRYPVVMTKNGRVKDGFVLVNGQEVGYPEGSYQIRTYEGRRMVYKPAGSDPVKALALRDREARNLQALALGKLGTDVLMERNMDKTMEDWRDEFLEKVHLSGRNTGLPDYVIAIRNFMAACNRRYPAEITKMDLLRYFDSERKTGLSERTVYNRWIDLSAFLNYCGVKMSSLLTTTERPRKPSTDVQVYRKEEIEALLAGCARQQSRIAFEFFWKTGMREREVMFVEWTDLDLEAGMAYVRNKPHLGFTVKTYTSRTIPLSQQMISELKAWKDAKPKTRFVFGTESDRPNGKFLRTLKREVNHAGLACGICESCQKYKECGHWYLHRFRSTYITNLLQGGVDLYTVMKLAGHSSIETTMIYLGRNHEVHAKIDAIFA